MQTLPANTAHGKRPRPIARCKGSAQQQTPLRTAGAIADGFLKHRFMPLCEPDERLPEAGKVAGGFFKSLGHMAGHFGFEPFDASPYEYPANILLTYWDARKKMKTKGRVRDLMVTEQEIGAVTLTVKETLDTGNTLFYIPVIPLYHWHNQPRNRKTAELLLSVCTYLYYHAGVPYYRDEDTYMHSNYMMMEEWIENDKDSMDEADFNRQSSELRVAFHYGDLMERRIRAKINLEQMKARIQAYHPRNLFETDCLELAKTTWDIWQTYPTHNIYYNENVPKEDDEDYDDDYYNFLHMEEYISFIGEMDSNLYESMQNMINNDLNEKSKILEPETTTTFEQAMTPYRDSLAYEQKVFDTISTLCDLLNDLP